MTILSRHDGKVWLVTGASSGLGYEIALAALERGDHVALAARQTGGLQTVTDRFPGQALALTVDVRDERAVQAAVTDVKDRFGRIDILANIAGYGLFGAVEEADDAQARAVFDTNVFGVLNVLRAVLPIMRAQGVGRILQGSSFYGQTAHPGVGMLAATKYAVEGLTDALVGELAPLGISITAVEPGAMATPFLANLAYTEPITDYDGTVRQVQRALGELGPADLSDPGAAARAVLAAVDDDAPPLRLALGRAAEDAIRTALRARLTELDTWSALSRSVDTAIVPA